MRHTLKLVFGATALLSGLLGPAAAQEAPQTRTLTCFEGEPIREIFLAGNFDVEIRQGNPAGILLEIPADIPACPTAPDEERRFISSASTAENLSDTLRYSLKQGVLRLYNTRRVPLQNNRSIFAHAKSGFQARAVITVDDLHKLSAASHGEIRLGTIQFQNAEFVCFNGTEVIGTDLRATGRLSISVFNSAKFEGSLSNTPEVSLKVFNNGEANIRVGNVDHLEGTAFNNGEIRAAGEVRSLTHRSYNNGNFDVTQLTVKTSPESEPDRTAQSHDSDAKADIFLSPGARFGIGNTSRIVTAAPQGIRLHRPGPDDTAVPKAGKQRVIMLEPGASIQLPEGTYRVTEENSLIVLHKES
ncbi:DUF2807 domain-containing protein [uncultured Rikenella sp.]|uniref:GIN domain-containing protein n=1 Tax=uncultured Rikenella sp. TaxID=368003 RepID=UPI0025F96303|nr:DUF2807 domain-containing protein [uncultured Rikenella sp.]